MNKRFHIINVAIIISFIFLPMTVLASVPASTSFDRHNTYLLDGYRDGGYYAVRHNSGVAGYMNMSHVGGTRDFNITSYNIKNLTLDMDLMFSQRKWLFGWDTVTWEDMVSSLGDRIVINLDCSEYGIGQIDFIDHPEVNVKVYVDGEVYRDWSPLGETEIYTDGFNVGETQIILEFDIYDTVFDMMVFILELIIVIGIMVIVLRALGSIFAPEQSYYKKYWGRDK